MGNGTSSERTRVDFNRIIRNTWGEAYRTTSGVPLRLGKVVIDAIEVAAGQRGAPIESDEKLRLADLARRIVNSDLDERVETAPFRVLMVPQRVVEKLDAHVAAAGFVTGVYAGTHRLLHGEEAQLPAFDDLEDAGVPDLWERGCGSAPDEVPGAA
jgi:hypothetical protein